MKNRLKKVLLAFTIVVSLFSLVGCGNSDDGQIYQIRFSNLVSVSSMQKYNNKTVSAVGYLSPVMGYDGNFGYLMNLPYQTCPYCVPSDTKITNTMAIFTKEGETIEFTEAAVVVKGTLKLEDYTDEYGYTYGYRMVDVTIELADTSNLGSKLSLYNQLADKEILTGIMDTLYLADSNIYYDMYIQYGDSYERETVDTTAIDEVIENLKSFDQNDVQILVTIADELKDLTVTTNKLVETEDYDKLADYQTQIDDLFNSINEWMADYEL